MKKIASILLISIYLLSTTGMNQLVKIPVVFLHYNEHKNEDRHISFLKYLEQHYMHGSPLDKDHERDMQLPFKTPASSTSSVSPDFVPVMAQYCIVQLPEIRKKKSVFSQDQLDLSPHLSNIWQPPKFS